MGIFYLADEEVCVIKVSSIEPWCLSAARLNLDANLLSLSSKIHSFVVHLNARYNTNVGELHSQQNWSQL